MPSFSFGKLGGLVEQVNHLSANQPSNLIESIYDSDDFTLDISQMSGMVENEIVKEYISKSNQLFLFGFDKWGDKNKIVGQ